MSEIYVPTSSDNDRERYTPDRRVTFHLNEDSIQFLSTIAMVDDTTMGDQISKAALFYRDARLNDPNLEEQANRAMHRFGKQ